MLVSKHGMMSPSPHECPGLLLVYFSGSVQQLITKTNTRSVHTESHLGKSSALWKRSTFQVLRAEGKVLIAHQRGVQSRTAHLLCTLQPSALAPQRDQKQILLFVRNVAEAACSPLGDLWGRLKILMR